MKQLFALSLFAIAAAATAAPVATPAGAAWAGARPAVNVSVARAGANTFRVSATVRDLRNNNVLSQPVLVVKAGVPAKAEVGATGAPGTSAVAFTVTVAPNGESASYESQIKSNGAIIATEEVTLAVGR
ncbi:hypothetical protein [Lysobacter sp. HA18]